VNAQADSFFARARDAINAGRPLGYDFSMGTVKRGSARGASGGRPAAARRSAPARTRAVALDARGRSHFPEPGFLV